MDKDTAREKKCSGNKEVEKDIEQKGDYVYKTLCRDCIGI